MVGKNRFHFVLIALGALIVPACGGEPEELVTEDGTFEEEGKEDSLKKFCGGIAAIKCPAGQKCKLSGTYPDAGGKCVKENYCDTTADCGGLIHPMCVGAWQCLQHRCSWKCGVLPTSTCQSQGGHCLPLTYPMGTCAAGEQAVTTPGLCDAIPGQSTTCCLPAPQPKKCGPYLGGQCAAGEVCNIQSCGLGGGGVCQPRPQACIMIYDPVCGCDGKTYGNDCERLMSSAPLDHQGECQPKTCWGAWLDQNGNCRTPADGVYPADCCLGQFCGGIAGIKCPAGQKCLLDGSYPDAGGKCVPL